MVNSLTISLFPLSGTVLYPGISLSLHIFEPRYQVMINRCLKLKRPFGVVLIKEGYEVGESAIPHTIGTTAYITHVQPLDGGRMNIQTVGQMRFRIREITQEQPFLVGVVEEYPLEGVNELKVTALASHLRRTLQTYANKLATASDQKLMLKKIPQDNISLAYLAAATLPLSPQEKQDLLAKRDLASLLQAENALLKREMALLEHMILRHQERESGPDIPFSLN